MVEHLAASYIALKLENEILQAQVQRLMEENAALQAQIPALQKSQAAKEDEPLQNPSQTQEPQKPPEPLGPPAGWDPQEPPEVKEAQKPPEPLGPPAGWDCQEPPEVKEAQKPPEPLGPPAAWEPSELPEVKEPQKPPEPQDLSAWEPTEAEEPQEAQKPLEPPSIQEPQNSEPQDPPKAEEPQEAPECQETSAQLEPLDLPAPQEPLEPWVPQESLDPSGTQELLELLAPQESLEGLIVVKTSAASEFPQAPIGLEAADFPLEYPLVFDGDAQKLSEFLIQLNSYMRVRGHLYPTEAALVSYVGNRFSDEAGRWFQPLLDIQSPLLEQFESFIQVLQDTFDNPENMDDANHCIRQLCQREGPVRQYVTHFYLIAQELTWDERTLCIQFQEGLPSFIRDELSHTSPANNLSDLITQCISLEEKLNGKPDPKPSGADPSEEKDGPESLPAENQPVRAASNRPHISQAERARRREGHLCLYCGHPGHFARDCPVKPHRAQQAGNIEARR
ncbi:retrotransposon Gag-like protein 3 [Cynocephalus volans]|uniref:retrotransposon Gag-like protein 3 n=1 Tax=Cynocephalus volans TaxID=110931 RepID=UPI002FCAAA6E